MESENKETQKIWTSWSSSFLMLITGSHVWPLIQNLSTINFDLIWFTMPFWWCLGATSTKLQLGHGVVFSLASIRRKPQCGSIARVFGGGDWDYNLKKVWVHLLRPLNLHYSSNAIYFGPSDSQPWRVSGANYTGWRFFPTHAKVKMGSSSPRFGVKIQNIWVATTQYIRSRKGSVTSSEVGTSSLLSLNAEIGFTSASYLFGGDGMYIRSVWFIVTLLIYPRNIWWNSWFEDDLSGWKSWIMTCLVLCQNFDQNLVSSLLSLARSQI